MAGWCNAQKWWLFCGKITEKSVVVASCCDHCPTILRLRIAKNGCLTVQGGLNDLLHQCGSQVLLMMSVVAQCDNITTRHDWPDEAGAAGRGSMKNPLHPLRATCLPDEFLQEFRGIVPREPYYVISGVLPIQFAFFDTAL